MDQRKTVLLADAGEEFRTLLWEEMEKTGEFSVEIARDGNEILKRVKERMPDLLVMDVMLPGMDGISVLRQLQKQGDAPMTILVSGFVSDRMLAEASELGAAYFLPKPFETAALLDKMRGLFLKAPQESLPSLKTMVTSVIHEIGVPAHIKGHHDHGAGYGCHQRGDEGSLSRSGQAVCHNAFPGGTGHPPRHRGSLGPGRFGDLAKIFRIYS